MKTDQNKTIYIMGRGHSGSTILSGLIGNLNNVNDIGELIYPMTKTCGCGKPFDECDFWLQVRREFESSTGLPWESSLQSLRDQAHFLRFPWTLVANKSSAQMKRLQTINAGVTDAILKVSQAERMLDSSKQPTRALLLMRQAPDAKFIHIVRGPESYLYSYMRRIERGQVNFLRREFRNGPFNYFFMILVALSWLIANIQSEIVKLHHPKRVLRIRYEDLTAHPKRELARMSKFLNLDFQPTIDALDRGQKMQVSHIIGGNDHMRADGGFVFEPKVGSHPPLPAAYSIMVKLISWPLMLLYRYPLSHQNQPPSSDLKSAVHS